MFVLPNAPCLHASYGDDDDRDDDGQQLYCSVPQPLLEYAFSSLFLTHILQRVEGHYLILHYS
jgi:hypothetical protein